MTTKKKSTDLSRRDLLRRSAVGAATVGGVSAGAIRLDHGPVGNAQAIPPLALPVVGAGTSMAAGWLLREYEVLGSDDPGEGLTESALKNQAYTAARARKSNNESTFLDNGNLLEGLNHVVYSEAKIAAIEKINEQQQEAVVQETAQDVVDDEFVKVQQNLLNSYLETTKELQSFYDALNDHPDTSGSSVFSSSSSRDLSDPPTEETTTTLVDGTETESRNLRLNSEGVLNSMQNDLSDPFQADIRASYDDNTITHIDLELWGEVWDEIEDRHDEVKTGISTWANEAYSAVQSGDIEVEELLTPTELAQLTSEDEDYPQAVNDLMALNIATDLEREAEIYLPEIEATIYGQLGYSGDDSLETGEVDPGDKDGDIYVTYDISQGSGTWSAHDDGLDGGVLTLTETPFEESTYVLTTAADETAEFETDDLEEVEEESEYTVDLSDQLDNAITDVAELNYYSNVETTQFETVRLTSPFEIIAFRDSDGNEYNETDFERTETQSDDNYITEEEWKAQQERHEELIEKYEDAQGGGGITIGGTSIPTELIGLGLAVAAAIGLLR